MGFLIEDEPLDWEEAISKLRFIRDHGIEQFVHIFHQVKYVQGDLLKWGDELEHGVFKLVGGVGEERRSVKVSLRSPDIIRDLKMLDDHGLAHGLSEADLASWMPEFGRWMLESTPRKPYEGLVDLLKVEDNMRLRRSRLLSALRPDEIAPTVSCMPLFGVGDFCEPSMGPAGPGSATESIFAADEVMFPHPRFPTLSKNIRKRRGQKVAIRRPRFEDERTPEPEHTDPNFVPETPEQADAMDHVYADCMAFGMGCCCLQVTFQAANITESTHLYDQLAVLTPVMLALTAATPFLRGWLMDEDSRWTSVAQSVDDRTPAELGVTRGENVVEDPRLAGSGKRFLRKSRYDSIDCFICNCKGGKTDPTQMYNDATIVYGEDHVQRLTNSGIDEILAKHIAHLFARDPLVILRSRIQLDDRVDVDHWENLQSTNWQTVRWKPPPPHKGTAAQSSEEHIGWRVEFRSMEIQITDFENAAFSAFIMLLSRVVLALELTLYIPISRLDENMHTAQKREAVTNETFWFRRNILPRGSSVRAKGTKTREPAAHESCRQMTIAEIFGGSDDFPGLMPLCETYLDFIGCDSVVRGGLRRYMDFILKRARGELVTPATWMRQFITSHPSYQKDSRVPPEAAYDLMQACSDIGEGRRRCPELHGDIVMPEVTPATNPFLQEELLRGASEGAAAPVSSEREVLLRRFQRRAAEKKLEALDRDIAQKVAEANRHAAELDVLQSQRRTAGELAARFPGISSPRGGSGSLESPPVSPS